jgi:hypothetical protein
MVDGKRVEFEERSDGTIHWGGNRISFRPEGGEAGGSLLTGSLEGYWTGGVNLDGASLRDHRAPFEGTYRAYLWKDNQWAPCGEFVYDSGTVRVGRHTIGNTLFDKNLLQWEGMEDGIGNGIVRFFIDPVAQVPKFVGSLWNSGPRPEFPNMVAVLALTANVPLEPPDPVGDIGVPPAVWRTVGAIGREGLNPGCHFLWSRWQRARFTSRVTNGLLRKVCAAVAQGDLLQSRNAR